jgi:hypothetical protein
MKKILLGFLVILWGNIASAQNSYKIDVNIKQFANQTIYLGYYFGKTFPIKDSIKLNAKGIGSFIGKEKLPGGIYLIGYPNKNKFFELLIDKNQQFSITADTMNIAKTLVIKNSPEGLEFQNYQKYMDLKGSEINSLQNTSDPVVIAKRKKINDEVIAYRRAIENRNPKGMLTTVFKLMEEPTIPDAKFHPNKKYDSTYAWYFYKTNYWKKVILADNRILRTPVFEQKFDTYFKNIVYPAPDSVKQEVDKVLMASITNKETFKFIASKLVERYVNPEYMGLDAVYVHIYEKYIGTAMMPWFDEKQRKFLDDRYYSLLANLVGDKAAPLELIDTTGKNKVSLYAIDAPYTIICFWDATCGHCKEVVPKLDSFYVNKWKTLGIKLLGVMTEGGIENYKAYTKEHNFTTWIHAYQPDEDKKADYAAGRPNFRQLYDIQSSPKLFLLDKEKRIIAKQITYDQLDKIIDESIKKKTK